MRFEIEEKEGLYSAKQAFRPGLGPYMIAEDIIFVMNDSGLLTLADASPSGYRRLARARVLKEHDSWGRRRL